MKKTNRPNRAPGKRRPRNPSLLRYRQRQGGYAWVYYVVMIIISILSYVLQPKPPKPKPAILEDFDLPTPDEGTPQRVIFGECYIKQWEVLWYGSLRTTSIKSKGGK